MFIWIRVKFENFEKRALQVWPPLFDLAAKTYDSLGINFRL